MEARHSRPVRVLVIDDSALVRKLMTELLSSDPGIEVVGSAADPFIARQKIKQLAPDVLTLDVEMPRMDGLTFLQNLMRLRPMPVVMVSSLTERGAQVTLDALALGAVDFVAKPRIDVARGLAGHAELLCAKVRDAAGAQVNRLVPGHTPAPRPGPIGYRTTDRLFAIGASTGGTEAIRLVLAGMPADAPAAKLAATLVGSAVLADFASENARLRERNRALELARQGWGTTHPNPMVGAVIVEDGRIVAEGTAFDTDELRLPADTPTPLTFENRDPAPHNVSIYENAEASGEPLFTFEPFAGPRTEPFDIEAISEGEYYFRCDVHPTMEGTVIVAPPPPGCAPRPTRPRTAWRGAPRRAGTPSWRRPRRAGP